MSRLVTALAGLPDAALVPVGWVRVQLDTELPVPADAPDLTVVAFAHLVGRSPATVRAWCERGAIPGAYKLPGDRRRAAWRIPAASVPAFRELHGRTTAPESPAPPGDVRDLGAWRRVRPRRVKRAR